MSNRILFGGRFLVSVEADLVVTGLSTLLTVSDSIRQKIVKPPASNYGVDYGTFSDNFSYFAGVVASGLQELMEVDLEHMRIPMFQMRTL